MNIALKEARESGFWIDLLKDAQYITEKEHASLYDDCDKLIAILVKIVKATKN